MKNRNNLSDDKELKEVKTKRIENVNKIILLQYISSILPVLYLIVSVFVMREIYISFVSHPVKITIMGNKLPVTIFDRVFFLTDSNVLRFNELFILMSCQSL